MFSCTFTSEGKEKKGTPANSTSNSNRISGLTPEQESAFNALNLLQVNTDEHSRLYSTFAGTDQPCYPPDTSFVITRSELLNAMMLFGKEYCTNLNAEERNKLINAAVMAQTEYTVLHCTTNSSNFNYEHGLPMVGIWVMPRVLGRRDVILEWGVER